MALVATAVAAPRRGEERRGKMYVLLRKMYSPLAALWGAANQGKEEEEGSSLRLKREIAALYDQNTDSWERDWGDHIHHGFYDPSAQASMSDHRLAQIRTIDETLAFAAISVFWYVCAFARADDPAKGPKRIVDVGCGLGGSSRYLANKYGAEVKGITLSSVEAKRAQALAVAQGLGDQVSFQVADALEQPFSDGQFDLVWSLESGEHMPDKTKFVGELARVAAPGATIILVTWCRRDLLPSEGSLRPDEINHLNRIGNAFHQPTWCSPSDYVKIAQSFSLEDIKTADWSENVAPFWPAIIRYTLTWRGIISTLRSGWKGVKEVLVMPLMIEGYKKKLIRYTVITCRKPEI